nr:histidine kinase dimerization/phospho-acceptor domain-containing protein [Clostridium botulinum]
MADKLQNTFNIKSQFVANVSHELKILLTSIKGFAETLRYVEEKFTIKIPLK